jgi:hypothetical protein
MKGDPSHSTNGNGTSNEKMKGVANGHAKKPAESHVAFPGGRMEAEDEDGLYTGKALYISDSFSNFGLSNASDLGRNRS